MRRVGDILDATTAFTGAAVAGVTLFLPVSVGTQGQASSYRIAGLLNSVPRGAALGMIVAVTVAVLVTTTKRPLTGWATATAAALAQLINHFAGRRGSTAEMLTTQNYIDAVCAAVLLGGLGAVVLRRPLPGAAFAVGGVGIFGFGDLAALLDITADPYAVLETPTRWMIAAALAMLMISTMHNWRRTEEPKTSRMAIALPVAPILAAMVLALVVLAGTEWLGRQYSKLPAEGHAVEIGIVVAATIVSATAAAMLLPGRDGTGVYLAVSLTAAVDAVGYAVRPGWTSAVLIALTAAGVAIGARVPSTAIAILLLAGIAVFAIVTSTSAGTVAFAVISGVIALTAGYCCGTTRPQYAPSGVLAISALYLPSAVSVMPDKFKDWREDVAIHDATPGRTALAIVVGSAIGLVMLRKLRPRSKSQAKGQLESESLADI
ncbi:hypothetical protein IU486_04130 [Streptomyces gardneri]|uniref:hypothetical protein n=1 Tax=Nocardia TaxID=1817 RepID=UPI001359C989|nr:MULTISPECIES: hypothetical protein [Nocardia]MBF6163962.1 hypothetical protein [Streptomyces gardneri]MBF6203538.1 hypothetical protein [Streptomyces gardneri]